MNILDMIAGRALNNASQNAPQPTRGANEGAPTLSHKGAPNVAQKGANAVSGRNLQSIIDACEELETHDAQAGALVMTEW